MGAWNSQQSVSPVALYGRLPENGDVDLLCLYLGGGLSGLLAGSMFGLSDGWKARLFEIRWDYRFTGLVFALLAAIAIGAGWYRA